jgi:small conductance mechanosensitive channel
MLYGTPRIDNTIVPLVSDLLKYSILALTFVIVLGQFGVQTASILAVIGAVGLAIALALQGTLSNMAAGILLLWLRPFNAGDAIDAEGISGSVLEIGLFGTRLRTYDGIAVYASNARLWNAKIINYSREPRRMVEVTIGIGLRSSIAEAREVFLNVARAEPRVLADPAPSAFVGDLGPSSMPLTMRAWVKSSDWWDTKLTLIEQGKLALEAAGIEIASQKLDVAIVREVAGGTPPLPAGPGPAAPGSGDPAGPRAG